MILQKRSHSSRQSMRVSDPHRPIEIRRQWVETADERCPLACVWQALLENPDEPNDDSGLRWPVFSFLRERAGILRGFHLFPAHSLL